MITLRTFVALSVAALATACASPDAVTASPSSPPPVAEHASHHPQAQASAPMAAMEPRMKAMREMHEKMMNAKTPEERKAMMADHMKAMQGGMGMMKGMDGMGAMSGPNGMPGDMTKRHQTMEQRMDMMQMMMGMMMDRMPEAPAKQ